MTLYHHFYSVNLVLATPKGGGGDDWILPLKKIYWFLYHLLLNFKKKKIISWTNLYKSAIPITHVFYLFANVSIFCVWVFCLYVCLCATSMPASHRGQKRAPHYWDSNDTTGSCLVSARNWTRVHWKSCQCGLNYWAISASWQVIFQSLFPYL